MSDLNKVMLIGRLGADPEIRYRENGDAIANIRLATSRKWKNRQSGEQEERTEWHRVVMFSRTAEIAGEYLNKGSQCFIEGRLQTRKWQDKDGNDRYTTEIVCDTLQLLGGRAAAGSKPQEPAADEDFQDDDIPF